MQIGVLEFNQDSKGDPFHFVSKRRALDMLKYREGGKVLVEKVHDFLLRIVSNITFAKLKHRIWNPTHQSRPRYGTLSGAPFVPQKLPPAEIEGTDFCPAKKNRQAHQRSMRLVVSANNFARNRESLAARVMERVYA